jgi:hypothetical protein
MVTSVTNEARLHGTAVPAACVEPGGIVTVIVPGETAVMGVKVLKTIGVALDAGTAAVSDAAKLICGVGVVARPG